MPGFIYKLLVPSLRVESLTAVLALAATYMPN